MGVMLKRYRVLITLSLILAVAHFRYELLWTSAPGLEVLRRSWSSLYRPGWAKTHGLVAKLLPQPRAESVVVGSSHLKRLITRNWVHSSEQSLRFFASTSNFAFQLYLERDLITALAPKHVIISFVPEEFKFSFHDELIYLPKPVSSRDLALLEVQLQTLEAGPLSPAAKASVSELRRWMWKSFFLRTTAFVVTLEDCDFGDGESLDQFRFEGFEVDGRSVGPHHVLALPFEDQRTGVHSHDVAGRQPLLRGFRHPARGHELPAHAEFSGLTHLVVEGRVLLSELPGPGLVRGRRVRADPGVGPELRGAVNIIDALGAALEERSENPGVDALRARQKRVATGEEVHGAGVTTA